MNPSHPMTLSGRESQFPQNGATAISFARAEGTSSSNFTPSSDAQLTPDSKNGDPRDGESSTKSDRARFELQRLKTDFHKEEEEAEAKSVSQSLNPRSFDAEAENDDDVDYTTRKEHDGQDVYMVRTRSKGYSSDEERRVIKKFDRRLTLFMAFLYLLSFLDRSSESIP